MKLLRSIPIRLMLLRTATLFALPFSLSATPVSWNAPQDISGDSDVSTAGAFVQAVNIAGSTTTVNGVTFDDFGISGGTVTSGHFSLEGNGGGYAGYGSTNAPFSNLSPEYQSLLSTGNFGGGNSVMTLTIAGLVVGDTYQLQVWINDSRSAFGMQGITATDGMMSVHILGDVSGMEGDTGQYALLTFIANGDEVITFQGDPTGGTTEEAFQLRDIDRRVFGTREWADDVAPRYLSDWTPLVPSPGDGLTPPRARDCEGGRLPVKYPPAMSVHSASFSISTRGKGTYDITSQVAEAVAASALKDGTVTVFVRHTSCSLIIMENADPTARRDLEKFFERLVPEDTPYFEHTAEGGDDSTSHIRSVLTRSSEVIPIADGRMQLGTWQGIFSLRTSPCLAPSRDRAQRDRKLGLWPDSAGGVQPVGS